MKQVYNENRNRKYAENPEYRDKKIKSSRAYYQANKKEINEKRRVTQKKTPGREPLTHKICPDCGVDKPRSEYYKKLTSISYKCIPCSKKDIKERQSKYYKDNYVHTIHRRRRLKDCTPPWLNISDVKEFYKKCPVGMHVDHIIPVKGIVGTDKDNARQVSGLHVPWNLQYLTKSENLSKGNFLHEDDLDST